MELVTIVFTLLMLVIYLALRWPFFGLPLHMDTGYYVSNNTICTRQLTYAKGWNASYAGCSKVVPEFLYSLIYIRHGGDSYKFYSRLYYSLYGYLVAVVVGYVAYVLSGNPVSYFIALAIFSLLISEPHYGIYFESGEQFELLPQVVGFLLIVSGIQNTAPFVIGAGVGLWFLESYFIKLSSLPAALVMGLGAGFFSPESIPFSMGFALVASLIYLLWIRYNGQSVFQLIKRLIGHEVHFGHQLALWAYLERVIFKCGFLFRICFTHPIGPILAVIGALYDPGIPIVAIVGLMLLSIPVSVGLERLHFWSSRRKKAVLILYLLAIALAIAIEVGPIQNLHGDINNALLTIYLAAVLVCYLTQAAQVWYYTIPLLPVIALLATRGLEALLKEGFIGLVLSGALFLGWLVWNYLRPRMMSLNELNRWTWLPHSTVPERNLLLEQAISELRAFVGRARLLVFGHYNQAYALLETSYPVSIVAPNTWLDAMDPGWKEKLHHRMASEPPEFILDSDQSFDPDEVESECGVAYGIVGAFPGDFRLFQLKEAPVQKASASQGTIRTAQGVFLVDQLPN